MTRPFPYEAKLASAARRFVREARSTYGDFGGEDEALAERVQGRVRARVEALGLTLDEETFDGLLAATRGADLCLALAWEAGCEGAWGKYAQFFQGSVRAAARSQGASEGEAQELADGLPGALLAGGSALARYQGRGSLGGWLAVIVRRRVIDATRVQRPVDLPDEVEQPGTHGDPTHGAALDESTRRLRQAMAPLAQELTDRETTVLLLKYQAGMPQRQIARALGISDSRVTRLLQHAFGKLGERLRAAFPGGHEGAFPGMEQVWIELGSCGKRVKTRGGAPTGLQGREGERDRGSL